MANYNPESLAFLNMMQDIIKRMASNSASCKQWCILIVTAILTFFARKQSGIENMSLVCIFPIVSFCFLDSYYLGLERKFRDKYNDYVKKVNSGYNMNSFLFVVGPIKYSDDYSFCEKAEEKVKRLVWKLWQTVRSFFSFSVFPFYVGMYLVVKCVAAL